MECRKQRHRTFLAPPPPKRRRVVSDSPRASAATGPSIGNEVMAAIARMKAENLEGRRGPPAWRRSPRFSRRISQWTVRKSQSADYNCCCPRGVRCFRPKRRGLEVFLRTPGRYITPGVRRNWGPSPTHGNQAPPPLSPSSIASDATKTSGPADGTTSSTAETSVS
ncbi:uncharacterized protein EV422DRAFT_97911 [Fimicolochytrium jonesii]|uniref:uncharacterized protein n=1 Tax=Fimicolochytrium jonesii TaxID=1396493 RepID=UPI0022FE1F8E|nr:uncharacterized protein EV422DRAFT_97911 [Fimicolochytrium jonesii]KAI8819584.1 hypothetical protein EV422DRAFT_97911 [Fimicolochytrium jonesii]